MTAPNIVTREILNDWILNDGLEHLFAEGYLHPDLVDPDDLDLRRAVRDAHFYWDQYESAANFVQDLVDEAVA